MSPALEAFRSRAEHAARMRQGRSTYETLYEQLRTVMVDATDAEMQAEVERLAHLCRVEAK